MPRRRASFLAAATLIALTASCRAIFGIDDFAGGPEDGGTDANGADATTGDAIANGDAGTTDATTGIGDATIDGALDASLDTSIPLVATDACAGCFVVGELDTAMFTFVFVGVSADAICWDDGVATFRCRARSGGPTAEYVWDSGRGALQGQLTAVAVGDHALTALALSDVVGLTLDGGAFRVSSLGATTSLNGVAALASDHAVVATGPANGKEEGGVAYVFPMATPGLNVDTVSLVTSVGGLGPVPGQLAFNGGSFAATTLTGIQRCQKVGAAWTCDPQTPTPENPFGVVTATDGAVGYELSDSVYYGGSFVGADGGVTTPHDFALSRGQLVFVQDDADGGAELVAWTPGAPNVSVLVPSLGAKAFAISMAGDDDAVVFVTYVGSHATIIEMKR
jgi:hypothetical protein